MNRRLPPLIALRSFEAAARHESFTLAASELYVTSSAIGHQIRALEEHLGTRLFHRFNRKVQLTDAGALYLARLRKVFDQIEESSRDIAELGSSELLTVSAPPSFLADWLIPRVASFCEAHPGIQLRFLDTLRHVDFESERIDAGIWYGLSDWPKLHSEFLFPEDLVPVCSPHLIRDGHALKSLADLAKHTLIHTERRLVGWGMILRANGHAHIDTRGGLRFLHSIQSFRAALQGLGVALGDRRTLSEYLADGRLVTPFELPCMPEPVPAYYFVCHRHALETTKIRAFRDWMLAALAAAPAGEAEA